MTIGLIIGGWLLLCMSIGFLSRKRRFGFYGGLLCAFLLTPPIMLLLLLMTAPAISEDDTE